MLATIYKATNIINGKPYIGFDSSWPKRQTQHLSRAFLPKSNEYNTIFHRAIRKYGSDAFLWEVIYASENVKHTLNVMESRFIQEHNSHCYYGHGYNMTLGGEGGQGIIYTKKMRKSRSRMVQNFWNAMSLGEREERKQASKAGWEGIPLDKRLKRNITNADSAKKAWVGKKVQHRFDEVSKQWVTERI